MQCYHPGFHLQPCKNVAMFLIFVYRFFFLPYSCLLACSHVCMLLESPIHLFSLFVIYWCCHFTNHLLLPSWQEQGPREQAHAQQLQDPVLSLCNCASFWKSARKKLFVDHTCLFNVPGICIPKGPTLLLWTLVSWQRSRPLQLPLVEVGLWLIEKPLLLANLSFVLLTSSGNVDFTAYFVAVRIIH